MRYAIISDVHANMEALTAVLQKIEAEGINRIVCLGDVVGYHADPNECIEVIRERKILCIAGNHDRAATGLKEPIRFGQAGKRAIYWTRGQLTTESKQFLESLPLTALVNDGGFLMVHASLDPEPNEEIYLYSEGQARTNFQRFRALWPETNVCFFGHTHRPMGFEFRDERVEELDPPRIRLRTGASYLINPGSVGQPRDSDPRASFLIFDSDRQLVQFHRVLFDTNACYRKTEQAGLIYQESFLSRSENLVQRWLEVGKRLRKRIRCGRNSWRGAGGTDT